MLANSNLKGFVGVGDTVVVEEIVQNRTREKQVETLKCVCPERQMLDIDFGRHFVEERTIVKPETRSKLFPKPTSKTQEHIVMDVGRPAGKQECGSVAL